MSTIPLMPFAPSTKAASLSLSSFTSSLDASVSLIRPVTADMAPDFFAAFLNSSTVEAARSAASRDEIFSLAAASPLSKTMRL